MKINGLRNIWLTGIYVLFLIMVFVLFAIIHNSSDLPGVSYILLFIIIIPGSLLYYLAFKQNTSRINELTHASDNQHSESQVAEEKEKTEAAETIIEEEIDIKKLLPKEKQILKSLGRKYCRIWPPSFRLIKDYSM
jgi:uncharacterized protein YacL